MRPHLYCLFGLNQSTGVTNVVGFVCACQSRFAAARKQSECFFLLRSHSISRIFLLKYSIVLLQLLDLHVSFTKTKRPPIRLKIDNLIKPSQLLPGRSIGWGFPNMDCARALCLCRIAGWAAMVYYEGIALTWLDRHLDSYTYVVNGLLVILGAHPIFLPQKVASFAPSRRSSPLQMHLNYEFICHMMWIRTPIWRLELKRKSSYK